MSSKVEGHGHFQRSYCQGAVMVIGREGGREGGREEWSEGGSWVSGREEGVEGGRKLGKWEGWRKKEGGVGGRRDGGRS